MDHHCWIINVYTLLSSALFSVILLVATSVTLVHSTYYSVIDYVFTPAHVPASAEPASIQS